MVTYLNMVLGHLLSWLVFAAVPLYAGLVLMRYRTDGPHYRLSFEVHDPARSLQHLAVWLGVKVLQGFLRFTTAILNTLLDASAEVGERVIRLSPTVQQSIRSRFLV